MADILHKEMKEIMAGKGHIVEPSLGRKKDIAELFSGIDSYIEIAAQVHAYQVEHNVSGLLIKTFSVDRFTIDLPYWERSLVLIDGDLDRLISTKQQAVDFFISYCREMQKKSQFYVSYSLAMKDCGDSWHMETTTTFINHLAGHMEWASMEEFSDPHELFLELGFGDINEAESTEGKDADCFYFSARQGVCSDFN